MNTVAVGLLKYLEGMSRGDLNQILDTQKYANLSDADLFGFICDEGIWLPCNINGNTLFVYDIDQDCMNEVSDASIRRNYMTGMIYKDEIISIINKKMGSFRLTLNINAGYNNADITFDVESNTALQGNELKKYLINKNKDLIIKKLTENLNDWECVEI